MRKLFTVICAAALICLFLVFSRSAIARLLLNIQTVPLPLQLALIVCGVVLASFPIFCGYLLINVSCGFLFGFVPTLALISTAASLGVASAHLVYKHVIPGHVHWLRARLRTNQFAERLILLLNNENSGHAIGDAVQSNTALKIVFLTRLTLIPFGFQNLMFSTCSSNLSFWHYLGVSAAGLLPYQVLNSLLGTNLRSLHDFLYTASGTEFSAAQLLLRFGPLLFEMMMMVVLVIYVIRLVKTQLRRMASPAANSFLISSDFVV